MNKIRNSNCVDCRLHETAEYVCLIPPDVRRNEVMVVGEAPGKREDETGKPFQGKAGKYLRELLDENGIKDPFITNAVSCRPPDNRTPKVGEIKACRSYMGKQMQAVQPKFVLLLGNTPLLSLLDLKGITSRRGIPIEKDGVIYLPTFHPAAVFYDDKGTKRNQLEADIRYFAEIIAYGGIPKTDDLEWTIVDDWNKVDAMVADLSGTVAWDTETSGLYPWARGSYVASVGFGTKNHQWCLPCDHYLSPWTPEEVEQILDKVHERLLSCFLVAHNGKFDVEWIHTIYGLMWRCDFDTMLAHYMHNENDRHSLKYLAQVYYGATDWEVGVELEIKQGKKGTLEEHCEYLSNDVYYTRKLRFTLGKLLRQDQLTKRVFDKIVMPVQELFTRAEIHGVYIEVDQMDEAEAAFREISAEALRELHEWNDDPEMNWGSHKQIAKVLYEDLSLKVIEKTPTGLPGTNESILLRLDHPIGSAILKYRGAEKNLSTFIEGWKPYLSGRRIHPSFKIHGTVTGRLSCEHPNLQQVPRDKRIRSLITAPPGWTIVEMDLSQIELRIAAELSQDPALVYAFQNGIDVHWQTAIREIARGAGLQDQVIQTAATWLNTKKQPTYGEAIETLIKMGPSTAAEIDGGWKEHRKKAKAINFGYLYGMWWKKFKKYAKDNYGVDVTDHEARESREAYFSIYGTLEGWHKRQKKFARTNGFVRSLSGRKRRLPDAKIPYDDPKRRNAERQAINSPVQSFGNELNLMAALQLDEEFNEEVIGEEVQHFVAAIHDAVMFEVRDDWVERFVTRGLEVMAWPKLLDEFNITFTVPIEAEAEIGAWGVGVSLEKWLDANTSSSKGVPSAVRPSNRQQAESRKRRLKSAANGSA
jgi:DNA polymerase-1